MHIFKSHKNGSAQYMTPSLIYSKPIKDLKKTKTFYLSSFWQIMSEKGQWPLNLTIAIIHLKQLHKRRLQKILISQYLCTLLYNHITIIIKIAQIYFALKLYWGWLILPPPIKAKYKNVSSPPFPLLKNCFWMGHLTSTSWINFLSGPFIV